MRTAFLKDQIKRLQDKKKQEKLSSPKLRLRQRVVGEEIDYNLHDRCLSHFQNANCGTLEWRIIAANGCSIS